MISDRMDINHVLSEMRAIKAKTQVPNQELVNSGIDQLKPESRRLDHVNDTQKTDSGFGQLMHQAVNNVNELQKTSKQLATAYEQGKSGVDITDVMIASQKASVSFQAMVQVRNKLVEAYRDVMNMPV